MKKLKLLTLTIFVLILATSCEKKEDEAKVQKQEQVQTQSQTQANEEKPTQKQEELSDEVLQNLVDMSDKEDLIASGKIKPAPEFVEIDGKMVRTSPEKYESEDECEKAWELFLWREKNGLFKKNRISYNLKYEDDSEILHLLKDENGIIRVFILYSTDFSEVFYDLKNNLFFALNKKKYKYEKDLEIFINSLNKDYTFIKQKNCVVTLYRGEDF